MGATFFETINGRYALRANLNVVGLDLSLVTQTHYFRHLQERGECAWEVRVGERWAGNLSRLSKNRWRREVNGLAGLSLEVKVTSHEGV